MVYIYANKNGTKPPCDRESEYKWYYFLENLKGELYEMKTYKSIVKLVTKFVLL